VEEIQFPVLSNWENVDSIGLYELDGLTNFAMVFSGYFKAKTD